MTIAYDEVANAQRMLGSVGGDGTLDRRELVRLATLAASSHNTQPWRFRLERRTVTILPDLERRCAVVDPDDSHLFRSLGCAAENLVHAAAAQGHAAAVAFDAERRQVRIDLAPARSLKPTPLHAAIVRRQCSRLAFDGRPIAAEALAALERAGRGEGVRAILIEDRRRRGAVTDLVRQGDRDQLGDPAFRRELIHWLRCNDAAALRTGDGLANRPMGQPSLPDWLAPLVLPFVLTGRAQARTDARNIESSPLLVAIVATSDTATAWVEAGRAYERLALQATALDLRTAFINQPIEVQGLRPELHALLGLEDETAQLVLRVGHGPETSFSLRRPVEAVIEQERA